MSGFVNFKERWPSKEKFYILVADKNVIDKRYDHVWGRFEIKKSYYHNLYWKLYFLLSPDVLEEIKNSRLKNYGLCLNHYLNESSLSWDEILNVKKVCLQLFQMQTFICCSKKV